MLATMREPPPRGSIQESVLQALLLKMDQIEFLKTKSIIQAVINNEGAQEALDAYRDLAFPYYTRVQDNEKVKHVDILKGEVAKGPLVITATPETKVRSKMKTRIVQRLTAEQQEASKRISKKLGRLM